MHLFYTDTRGADISRAVGAAGSGRLGSAWGRSLLQRAWEKSFGGALPRIVCDAKGKPGFENAPGLFFSLSHTEGLAVCAIGEVPVGVDAERPRELRPGTADKLLSPEEAAEFDFFRVWTLRESCFKLTGQGGVRAPRFRRADGRVRCADETLHFTLLELCGCPVSLCTPAPVELRCVEIPVSELVRE